MAYPTVADAGAVPVWNSSMHQEAPLESHATRSPTVRGVDTSENRGWRDTSQSYAPFQQPWWLDAVAPGVWDEVRVERDGELLARMPFMIKRRFGLTALTQPSLTQFLGPWLSPGAGKYTTELARQKELMLQLIAQLPSYDVCRMQFAPQVTNWLPFYWAGFTATPLYTYRIPDLSDEDALWAEIDAVARNEIRKAMKKVVVRADLGIDASLELQERTYARHGWAMPDRNLFYRLDEACSARGCCRNFVAEDARGRQHASYYIVWDDHCAYAVGGGINHDLARSGAGTLVRWESARFASKITKAFDFVGSMDERVERVFRRLGGRQTICLSVSKYSRRMRTLSAAQEFALALTRG